MAKIYIDNKEYEVDGSKNLLEVCLSLGYNLPYFCYHPGLGSVGACRQCAVKKFKDDKDKTGKLAMACMEPITDNLRISIEDPQARDFRKTVIEWLMTNHPHDCPVCDEGGECHLQDMTVMTGHDYRRFRFNKRTHINQDLGPFINHEMNRCIECYRCVRFYRDFAGGKDLDVFGAHNQVYFGRAEDGVLENEFSGNLVEICPTGVFTDKTLKKHYTRKWDLTDAPSICEHCSLGCNTIEGERYGSVRRVLSRYNSEVNGYFLCDRGRFGYEYNTHPGRIKVPSVRTGDEKPTPLKPEEAIRKAAETISSAKRVIGIGSPRASLEANYALKRLVREENFYAGIDPVQKGMIDLIQDILTRQPVKTPGLGEISKCDTVVILGEDLTQTVPMMALAVRQAVRQKPMERAAGAKIPHWQDASVRELIQDEKGPLFIAAPFATKLEDVSTRNHHAGPVEIAALAFAAAHELDADAPDAGMSGEVQGLAKEVAEALRQSKHPLIISGTSCMEPLLIEAACNLAMACYRQNPETKLNYVVPECNSMGLSMLEGKNLDELTGDIKETDVLILLENDLYLRESKEHADGILQNARQVIVLDHLENETARRAHLLLPAGTTSESEGTYVSQEGRMQRFYQVLKPAEGIMESWRWLNAIGNRVHGVPASGSGFETLVKDLAASHPQFSRIQDLTPPPGFRVAGQKIAREPHRYSGRTAMHAAENVSEPRPPEEPDTPFTSTMEGYQGKPPSSLIPFFWSPGWNSIQSINKYQIEVGGPLHGGDPGIRLLVPEHDATLHYHPYEGDRKAGQKGRMIAVPRHHIFGSGELSGHSAGIVGRSPGPYIGISAEETRELGIGEGESIEILAKGMSFVKQARIIEGLPGGILAVPVESEEFFNLIHDTGLSVKKCKS